MSAWGLFLIGLALPGVTIMVNARGGGVAAHGGGGGAPRFQVFVGVLWGMCGPWTTSSAALENGEWVRRLREGLPGVAGLDG